MLRGGGIIARVMTQQPLKGIWARLRAAAVSFRDVWRDHRFYLWTLLLVAGFAYVGGVLCDRAGPLQSRGGGYWEIAKLLIVTPFLFFVGPRHNLRRFSEGWLGALKWNGLGYVLPFSLGLQYYYLQSISIINYSLTWSDLSRMPVAGKAVFLGLAALIATVAVYHIYLAHKERIAVPYVLSFVGAVLVLASVTWLLHEDYYFHAHHYFFFGFFIPWTRFRNPVSLVCQGVCAGIYVEGVSEWGMATLWYARH